MALEGEGSSQAPRKKEKKKKKSPRSQASRHHSDGHALEDSTGKSKDKIIDEKSTQVKPASRPPRPPRDNSLGKLEIPNTNQSNISPLSQASISATSISDQNQLIDSSKQESSDQSKLLDFQAQFSQSQPQMSGKANHKDNAILQRQKPVKSLQRLMKTDLMIDIPDRAGTGGDSENPQPPNSPVSVENQQLLVKELQPPPQPEEKKEMQNLLLVNKMPDFNFSIDTARRSMLKMEGMSNVQWTEFENRFASAIENEPEEFHHLFDLHSFDFTVNDRPRHVHQREFLEKLLDDTRLNAFSRECVLSFLNDWKIVTGSLFDHSLDKGGIANTKRILSNVNVDKTNKKDSHVERTISPQNTAPSSLEPEEITIDTSIFAQTTEEAILNAKESMQKDLPKHLFKAMHEELSMISSDQTNSSSYANSYLDVAQPFAMEHKKRLAIEFCELNFACGIEEPVFCSLALYDIKQKQKLSESLHLQHNAEEFNLLFETNTFTGVKRCLIPLGLHQRSDIYIIIRIDKFFSGDFDKEIARYSKIKKKKDNKTYPIDYWVELGMQRQPFVWTAINLYEEKKLVTGQITIDEFRPFRNIASDEYIFEQLAREIEVGKKPKTIAGSLVLKVELQPTIPPNTVDPSFNYIEESISQSGSSQSIHSLASANVGSSSPTTNSAPQQPITATPSPAADEKLWKDLQWFGSTNEPFFSYVNNLYFYPQTIFFKQSLASVALKIEVKEDEGSKPLNVMYTNWGNTTFSSAGYTAAIYKEKRPQIGDEIKIQLPGVLTENHHVLITLLNLPSKEVVGYAYFPLFSNTHGIIKDSRRSIAIESELKPGYLGVEVEPIKISETKKSYIILETRLISSIYPESNALFSLSHVFTSSGSVKLDGTAQQVLQVIQRLPPSLCLSFFPAILNCLMKILVCGCDEIASLSVICLITVLKKVREIIQEKNTTCNSLLLTYVRFLFSPALDKQTTVHEVLCKYWVAFIETDRPEVKNMDQGEMWILLNIMLKSMIMKLCEDGPPAANARKVKFTPSFATNLEQLVLLLFCVAKEIRNMDVLTMVPLFMKDLLGIIDRGIVFQMIYGYICWLNSENHTGDLFLATVKFTFIKIITDYKYYVPLNLPHQITITGKSATEIVQKFWTEHFFAGLIVREVRAGLLQKQRIREQSIGLLRNLLQTHDMDERYNKPETKSRIAGLYFPFVITTIEFREVLTEYFVSEEKVNWLLCFFYIIRNCSRELLDEWWTSCSPERRADFFIMLQMSTKVFKDQLFYNPICFIIVDTVLHFITLFSNELQQPDCIELPHIFQLLQNLQYNQFEPFIIALYNLLTSISKLFSKPMFLNSNCNYCASLALQVLYHGNSEKATVRKKASSLYYYLLKKNYEETGDIHRMQLQSTISLCKLLSGENKVKEYSNLRKSLKTITSHSQVDPDRTLGTMIENGINQISRLLRFNEQLAENDHNPEVMAELIYKIADSYAHSPNLRITWLEALATHHSDHKAWCEASLVHVQLASIIVEYLEQTNCFTPISLGAFKSIFPDCDSSMLPKNIEITEEESSSYTVDALIKHLEKAILFMKQAKQYEICIELYNILIQAVTAKRNYTKLTDYLTEFNHSVTVLIEADKEMRMFPKFFRVAFYGNVYKEENGREFIYRCDPKSNLMTIQQYLKEILSQTYGATEDQIEVIGNKPIDKDTLEDNKFYIQVAMVYAFAEDQPKDVTLTPFQTQFAVDKFLFESAAGHGEQQSKKKTIFKTKYRFPHITSRIEIIHTKEILLSPLESAIDLINDRIIKFKGELNVNSHHDVKLNSMQQLLQGSVVPMVNEGPFKICETFLSEKERGKHPPEQIEELELAMHEFIKVCGFAVKLTNQVIELRQLTEYEQFQSMIDTQYHEMRKKIYSQYLTQHEKFS